MCAIDVSSQSLGLTLKGLALPTLFWKLLLHILLAYPYVWIQKAAVSHIYFHIE